MNIINCAGCWAGQLLLQAIKPTIYVWEMIKRVIFIYLLINYPLHFSNTFEIAILVPR